MELLFAPNNTSVQNGYQYHCNVSRMLTTGFTQFRDIMAMAAGAAAGILGLVNFNGFLFYLVVHIITSVALLSKVKYIQVTHAPNIRDASLWNLHERIRTIGQFQ